MSDVESYVEAVQEYEEAARVVRELHAAVSAVGTQLQASRRFDFAGKQTDGRLIFETVHGKPGANWPSEEEILNALRALKQTYEKADAIWDRIPEKVRAGLKAISPKHGY